MASPTRILVAVDDTEASIRAARTVAARSRGHADRAGIVILHILPPVPPRLLEHGGSEDPEEEQQLEAEYAARRSRHRARAEAEAEPLLDRCERIFRDAGIPGNAVRRATRSVVPEDSIVKRIVEVADQEGCDVIAVGRNSLPWYREIFHRHVGEQLESECGDERVWVID